MNCEICINPPTCRLANSCNNYDTELVGFCDECNQYFGDNIELYVAYYREESQSIKFEADPFG